MSEQTPLQKSQSRLGVVCRDQGFKLRARVPADMDDDDLVISSGMTWAEARIAELTRERDEARKEAIRAFAKGAE